jgi:sec-independent protein translocase protein TatB
MFNVGIGEIFVILLVCLVVFGPERLPEMARKAGRLIGQLQLLTQGALDQLKEEAGDELNLPDLRVGSLRAQARDYLRELMDIDAQMVELQRERQRLRAALEGEPERVPFDHEAT